MTNKVIVEGIVKNYNKSLIGERILSVFDIVFHDKGTCVVKVEFGFFPDKQNADYKTVIITERSERYSEDFLVNLAYGAILNSMVIKTLIKQ